MRLGMKYGRYAVLLWMVIGAVSGPLWGQSSVIAWRAKVERVNTNTYDLVFEAQLGEGWALYAARLDRDDGPIPTTFMFQQHQGYRRLGDLYEYPEHRTTGWDGVFEQTVAKYHTLARFKQRILADTPVVVYVPIEYMCCNDRSCLPARYVELALDLRRTGEWVQPYRVWD